MAVSVEPDRRLKQRAGDLEGEGDHSDFGEVEREVIFEDRIDGGNERLDGVVHEVRQTEREQHGHIDAWLGRRLCGARRRRPPLEVRSFVSLVFI